MNVSFFFFFKLIIIQISIIYLLAYAFLRLENMTVTHNEHVQFRCQLPRSYSPKENIIQ